jgi:hypothetical protein
MALAEILIDGVFMAALLMGVACLVYVLYAMILERHVLRARRGPARANAAGEAARSASSPVAVSSAVARDNRRRRAGFPALR